MTPITRRLLLAGGAAFLAAPARGASMFDPTPQEQERFIEALKTPGHALLLRHALAPGHNDPGDFQLGACQTQRNLDDVGRAQAVAIGDWLRARDVRPAAVYTSQWCRCRDTADLMGFEPVIPDAALNSISDMPGSDAAKMGRLRRLVGSVATRPGPAILVTHSNVSSRLMGGLIGSGEGVVLRVAADGSAGMVGRVLFGRERM